MRCDSAGTKSLPSYLYAPEWGQRERGGGKPPSLAGGKKKKGHHEDVLLTDGCTFEKDMWGLHMLPRKEHASEERKSILRKRPV